MSIDASAFLNEEVKRLRRKFDEAIENREYKLASKYALRISVLLREAARMRVYGSKSILQLAMEYEEIGRRLSEYSEGSIKTSPPKPGGEGDFNSIVDSMIIEAGVSWRDIVGLDEAKKSVIEAVYYSVAEPEAPVRIEPPRNILLYGPPGTGKTMLAMAASRMIGGRFFYASIESILSKYVGDSPKILSALFRRARELAPSIVFFDEVEAISGRRGGREPATGLVQTLLTELDGVKSKCSSKPVIVIAATNKPWLIDEAVLSRFEKKIYTPLPGFRERMKLFKLELEEKGFKLNGVSYEELARLTEGYSGREIRSACREAVMLMLRRVNPHVYNILLNNGFSFKLKFRVDVVRRSDILEAISRIKPAVTREDIERYREWGLKRGF